MFWLSQILSDDDNSFHLELKRWYIELNIHLHNFILKGRKSKINKTTSSKNE